MALANHRVRVFKNVKDLEIFINTAAAAAVLVSGAHTFGFTFGGVGETLVVEGSNDRGQTWAAFSRTFTVGAAGPHANIAALLAELNTAARWDGASLPTEFVITNAGDTLLFTHAITSELSSIRIAPTGSTAIGPTTDEDLQLTAGQLALGSRGSVGLLTVEQIFTDDNGSFILVYTV